MPPALMPRAAHDRQHDFGVVGDLTRGVGHSAPFAYPVARMHKYRVAPLIDGAARGNFGQMRYALVLGAEFILIRRAPEAYVRTLMSVSTDVQHSGLHREVPYVGRQVAWDIRCTSVHGFEELGPFGGAPGRGFGRFGEPRALSG